MTDGDRKANGDDGKQSPKLPAVVLLFLAFLGVIGNIFETTSRVLENWIKLPRFVQLLLAALIGIVAIIWLYSALQKKSQLKRVDEFQKRVFGQEMFGRAPEAERLISLCERARLVFVIGESGVGKSTLLREGLVKGLKERAHVVYVNSWGYDFNQGPKTALSRAIQDQPDLDATVKSSLRALLCPWTQDTSEGGYTPKQALAALGSKHIVLVLDQFDEYQLLHRFRFIEKSDGTWINPDELCKNDFWMTIRDLVQREVITCVLAARSDTVLEPVRLVQPKMYSLGGFREKDIDAMLEKLTVDGENKSFITHPAYGWEQLKEELRADLLRPSDVVLPMRIKLALGGLPELRALTPADYARKGRLIGLETAYVFGAVDKMALAARLPSETVLSILLTLVGKNSRSPRSLSLSATEIAQEVHDPDEERSEQEWKNTIQDLLNHCEVDRIVRKHIDEEYPKREVWSLNHDFFGEAIQNAKASRDIHFQALEQRKKQYERARGILQKWRGLLSVGEQLRFFQLRLRKKLKYRSLRGYALKSTVRFVPFALLSASIVAGSFYWLRWSLAMHFAEALSAHHLPIKVLTAPRWAKLTILKSVVDNNTSYLDLTTNRAIGLINDYASSATEEERANLVNEILIPCALHGKSREGRRIDPVEFCSEKAIEIGPNKIATAKALGPRFGLRLLSNAIIREMLPSLNFSDWKELAVLAIDGIAGRKKGPPRTATSWTVYDLKSIDLGILLKTANDLGSTNARVAFLIDHTTRIEGHRKAQFGQLFMALSVFAALKKANISLTEAQQEQFAQKIAYEFPDCIDAVCAEAVQVLLERHSLLSGADQRLLENTLATAIQNNDEIIIEKLSSLCKKEQVPPISNALELRTSLLRQLPGGITKTTNLNYVIVWACLLNNASDEERNAAAKKMVLWMSSARPEHLPEALSAFLWVRDALSPQDLTDARAQLVKRFIEDKTAIELSQLEDADTIRKFIEGGTSTETAQIFDEFFNGILNLVTSAPAATDIPAILRWFDLLTKETIHTNDQKWQKLTDATFNRAQNASRKFWVLELPDAAIKMMAPGHKSWLHTALTQLAVDSYYCNDALEFVVFRVHVCALSRSEDCAKLIENTVEHLVRPDGPCNDAFQRQMGQRNTLSPRHYPMDGIVPSRIDWPLVLADLEKLATQMSGEQQKAAARRMLGASCTRNKRSPILIYSKNVLQALCQGPAMADCQRIRDEIPTTACPNKESLNAVLPKP